MVLDSSSFLANLTKAPYRNPTERGEMYKTLLKPKLSIHLSLLFSLPLKIRFAAIRKQAAFLRGHSPPLGKQSSEIL